MGSVRRHSQRERQFHLGAVSQHRRGRQFHCYFRRDYGQRLLASKTLTIDFPGPLNLTARANDNKGAQGVTNVTVNITTLPPLTLDPIGFQTNGSFKLLMLGEPGMTYQVLSNNDVNASNWPVLGVMESTNGILRYFDKTATNPANRFYRARQAP